MLEIAAAEHFDELGELKAICQFFTQQKIFP